MAVSFFAFLPTSNIGLIKEDGSLRIAKAGSAIAPTTSESASLSASSCLFSSGTIQEVGVALSSPEFLSLGELKDPGILMGTTSSRPSAIISEASGIGHESGLASSLSLNAWW